MNPSPEVLVTLLKTPDALKRAKSEGWYHVPVASVRKWAKKRWPPQILAFYQGKVHLHEAYSVRYFADVLYVETLLRTQLFPDEPDNPNAAEPYHKVHLGSLQELPKPIFSRRLRRVVFIPTTWQKFRAAVEINDLYDESPLEDQLWAEFKRIGILAERQVFVGIGNRNYALDFAIYCHGAALDVEADGDTWHSDPKRIPEDNRRDNDLETAGYKLLRFNTLQVREQMAEYCVPTIIKNIESAGGQEDGRVIPRQLNAEEPEARQLSLFDD
jgi:very-short-patch-repair endonuclease